VRLAARVVEHLEQSGFEIDEEHQVLRKRPPTRNHGWPAASALGRFSSALAGSLLLKFLSASDIDFAP
jgi:hypothetical protein